MKILDSIGTFLDNICDRAYDNGAMAIGLLILIVLSIWFILSSVK